MTVQDALPGLLQAYLPILIFLLIAVGLAVVMAFGSMVIGPSRPDSEKLSAYECGFEAFNDSRGQFDVRFYLVAILFILFDIETVFLLPYAVVYKKLGIVGLAEMGVFILILAGGLVYLWKRGALEWD